MRSDETKDSVSCRRWRSSGPFIQRSLAIVYVIAVAIYSHDCCFATVQLLVEPTFCFDADGVFSALQPMTAAPDQAMMPPCFQASYGV